MVKSNVTFMINKNCVTVNFSGKTHTFNAPSKEYDNIKLAIQEKDLDRIPDLVDVATNITQESGGFFTVVDGLVNVDGKPCPNELSNRILEFRDDGLPVEPLVNFAKKANKNPSYRARQQLFTFLDVNKHPITDEGNFIAYKKVGKDFMDLYSHTFDNHPGNIVEMKREDVDDDPNNTCSNGLHVANFTYAHNQYGSQDDPTLEVEVDPADVVSVPTDYNGAKMRVCRYKVIGLSEAPRPEKLIYRNPPTPGPVTPEMDEDENPCNNCPEVDTCEAANPDRDEEEETDGCDDVNCESCYPYGY